MATFVQANSAAAQAAGYPSNVTAGNLLVCYYANNVAAGGIADTIGNAWTLIVAGNPSGGGGETPWAWGTISKSSAANTVVIGGTASNEQICIAEYSGAGIPIPNTSKPQALGLNDTSVNCGPTGTISSLGALFAIVTFGQATGYASTSGSTNRTTVSASRMFIGDNLSAIGSYTESGTLSASSNPMQFGGGVIVIGASVSGSSWDQSYRDFVYKRGIQKPPYPYFPF